MANASDRTVIFAIKMTMGMSTMLNAFSEKGLNSDEVHRVYADIEDKCVNANLEII